MSTALFNLGAILQSCGSTLPKIPEPLAPPSNLGVYNTRGAAKADGVPVAYTAQMVPVVTALIDAALTTSAVREILDTGNEELKECQREAREATKFEREKWDADGGGKTKVRQCIALCLHRTYSTSLDQTRLSSSQATTCRY